jgi:nitrate reductase alpha subunit
MAICLSQDVEWVRRSVSIWLSTFLVLALATTIPSAASAVTVTSDNAQTYVTALANNGYKAKIEKDSDGNPSITTSVGGNQVLLSFSSCTNGDHCQYVELISTWSGVDDKTAISVVNKWNSEEHFASTVCNKSGKTVSLYHYIITSSAGISAESLVANLEYLSKEFAELQNALLAGAK